MQLRESKPLGMLDHHHRRVRDVDPDFDHAGRDEDVDAVVAERPHRPVALLRLKSPVDQADHQLREDLGEPVRHRGRGFQIGALRLLDHGIDHVHLAARGAFAPEEAVDLGPCRLGAQRRLHAAPSRWPFAQLGDVQIAVQGERQRAGDRRRREQEHVRRVTLLDEGGPLLDPEPVLLVDHREPEAPERHRFLDQCVCPDYESRRSGGDPLACRRLLRRAEPADQELRPQGERLEQLRQGRVMLLGEELGRRHDHRLVVVLDREQHGEQGHDRLSGADVAHQQAMHADGCRHVVGDLADGAPLVAGELERQVGL